ncbi:MAG: LamG domain-containing protein [Candidatus Dormibacteria bacterium]
MRPLGSMHPGRLLWVAGVLGAALVASAATGATGGFDGAVINTPQAGSGALVAQVAANSATCVSSGDAVASDSKPCPTPLLPEGAIPAPTAPLTGTATVSDLGSSSGTGMLTGAACGALGAADASGNGDPGLIYQGVAGAAGPFAGSRSLAFDGSTGWVQTASSHNGNSPITEMAWFKTTGEGTILADTNSQSNTGQTGWDRQVWVDGAGNLVYGVYPGSIQEVVSLAAYNTGQWYFVVASVGPAGEQLYVDGALAAPVNTGATSAQNYPGWFHIGWGSEQYWPNAPASAYFGGAIADAAIWAGQLTAAQVSALYGAATSQATFANAVKSETPAPLAFWPLQNTGYIYPDAIPGGASTFPDASGNGNTGTGEGGVTQGSAGPYPGGLAASFNGTAYVETTNASNPQVLSESVWFNTTSGGVVMGMTNLQANAAPNEWDRAIWLDASGQVVYGDYPGSTQEVISPGSYANGAWHLAVAEVGPAGEQLYVDGALVASNATDTTPQSYDGWWHLGWGNEAPGWPNPPASNYFSGSLADAAVYGTQLTAAQVSSLWVATSQAAAASAVLALSPTSFWTLGQSNAGVCGSVGLSVQETSGTTTTCLVPAGAGACPALTGSGDQTLESMAGQALNLQSIAGGATVQLTFRLAQEGTIPSGYVGLHPTLPLSSSLVSPGWVGMVSCPVESLVL